MNFFVKASLFLAVLVCFHASHVRAGGTSPVTVATWGKYPSNGLESYQFKRHEKKGSSIDHKDLHGDYKALKDAIDEGVDVVELPAVVFEKAISEGLIDKNSTRGLDFQPQDFIPGAFRPEGVAAVGRATTIIYRVDVLKNKIDRPNSMVEFWDVKKFPGKRGLVRGPRNNLEWALMADGVDKGEVYKILATDAGLERAINKLEKLKDHIIWFNSQEEVMEAMKLAPVGKVVNTPTSPYVILGAVSSDLGFREIRKVHTSDSKGFLWKIMWEGQLIEFLYWAKSVNLKNEEAANAFIKMGASEKTCLALVNRLAVGITYKKLLRGRKIQKYVLQNIPTFGPNLKKGLIVDGKFWMNNMKRLTNAFNDWLSE